MQNTYILRMLLENREGPRVSVSGRSSRPLAEGGNAPLCLPHHPPAVVSVPTGCPKHANDLCEQGFPERKRT